jgi:hypothetical protein
MSQAIHLNSKNFIEARRLFYRFIDECRDGDGNFRLTPRADPSAYALCFAIFGYRLIQANDVIESNREVWDRKLRDGLFAHKLQRQNVNSLCVDKPYLQLLTFTLSALSILGTLDIDPLSDAVAEVLPTDVQANLIKAGSLRGIARSGNHAMFMAILLLYARDHLGIDTQSEIEAWVALHRSAINCFGFWGSPTRMSYLQFQNGYHQYEIFDYLDVYNVPWEAAAHSVASLADKDGHFAPYPGGGGCYDYDAVFILTAKPSLSMQYRELLMRTASAILSEQNRDGGFCESIRIRPRSIENMCRGVAHVFLGPKCAKFERLRSTLTLLRGKHDRIQTHWSAYSRAWGESDLWDSWFRMLTLARIDCALNQQKVTDWGFINFPGLGFHPSAREEITR